MCAPTAISECYKLACCLHSASKDGRARHWRAVRCLASRVLRRMRSVSQSALQKLRLPTNRCVVFRCSVGDRHCPAFSTNARTKRVRKHYASLIRATVHTRETAKGAPKSLGSTFRCRLAPPSHTNHSDAHECPDINRAVPAQSCVHFQNLGEIRGVIHSHGY